MVSVMSKPVTPSSRGYNKVKRNLTPNTKPVKSLTVGKKSNAGRNNTGRITTRHKGGGHKQKYRIIDFKRNKLNMFGTVMTIEYDPNRTANIALIKYEDGELAYIIAPENLKVGDKIISSESSDIKTGNCSLIQNIPVGTFVHNIELKPGAGAQISRAAGTYAQIVGKDSGYAKLKLRSGEVRIVSLKCKAVIGVVSNAGHQNATIGKAGRNRWLGIRPTVRGVAMNPIDHPHGGGEGKTSGGRHPVSPTGKPTKGKKTRNNKRTNKFIVSGRKRNNKR